MVYTPAQPTRHYGIGAVNYHTGETVVLVRRHKRRREIAELLQALVDKHPTGTVYVAWDNANTHEDDEVEAVVRGAAGRLVLLYLPTYSPWLNPIEMLWRHFRREVTHCELFETVTALLTATRAFFDRHNQQPNTVLSIIGSHATQLI
jgi:transposase